jgi:hypothetical protein
LLDTKVLDALDKMICDGELEFFDARIWSWSKWERMQKQHCTMVLLWPSYKLTFCFVRQRIRWFANSFGEDDSTAKWVAGEYISDEANDLFNRARSTKDSCVLQYNDSYCTATNMQSWISVRCAKPHATSLTLLRWW